MSINSPTKRNENNSKIPNNSTVDIGVDVPVILWHLMCCLDQVEYFQNICARVDNLTFI